MDHDAVYRLWDELADFSAENIDEALLHLMRTFAGWLNATDIVWIGAVRLVEGVQARRDTQLGWRALAVTHLNPDPEILRLSALAAREQDSDTALSTRRLVSEAGTLRVHRLSGNFIDWKAFRATKHYRVFYQQLGIRDRIYVGCPVNHHAESYLLVDRIGSSHRHFTSADTALVHLAMRGLKWFHRELLLAHGLLVAKQPLTPMERRIVRALLTPLTEKQIADRLGQSPATTHKYITEIFRKYGVSGRTGLMALWLGHQS